MKSIVFVLFVGLTQLRLSAQVKLDHILKSSLKDINLRQNQLALVDMAEMKFNIPIVKSLEARVGFNGTTKKDTIYGYLRNEDHYGLTIKLNSIQEIRSQKFYKKAALNRATCESKLLLENAIKERYELIVSIYFTEILLQKNVELSAWIFKKDSVFKAQLNSGIVANLKDLLKLQEEKRQLTKDHYKLIANLNGWYERLSILTGLPGNLKIDTVDFVTVSEVISDIRVLLEREGKSLEAECKDLDISISNARLGNVKSQGSEILDGISVGYQDPLYLIRPTKFNTLNNFSLRASIKWPIKANNNFRVSRAKIDLLENQNKLYNFEFQLDQDRLQLTNQLKINIEYYKNLVKDNEDGIIGRINKSINAELVLQPLEWIELNSAYIKDKMTILELQEEIFNDYIKLLKLNGKLIEEPYINYLNKGHNVW